MDDDREEDKEQRFKDNLEDDEVKEEIEGRFKDNLPAEEGNKFEPPKIETPAAENQQQAQSFGHRFSDNET